LFRFSFSCFCPDFLRFFINRVKTHMSVPRIAQASVSVLAAVLLATQPAIYDAAASAPM
jgi:hypothetical protein